MCMPPNFIEMLFCIFLNCTSIVNTNLKITNYDSCFGNKKLPK